MRTTYTKYSTSYKYFCVLIGKKPSDVPKSTFFGWNHTVFNAYKGMELDKRIELKRDLFLAFEKNKKLEKLCFGLLQLTRFHQKLIQQTKNKLAFFRKNKDLFIAAYDRLKKSFSSRTLEKRLMVSAAKLTRWKQIGQCRLSTLKLCFVQNVNQLVLDDALAFRDMLFEEENEFLFTNHIWAKAFRTKGIMMSRGTAYKLNREFKENVVKVKTKKTKKSVFATRPFEILHMDSTLLVLQNKEKVYLHFIMDNYSRMILGAVISHSSRSSVVVENLRAVLKKYNLKHTPFELYCDGGPENQGEVNKFFEKEKIPVTKIIANYLDETSNNMAEAWHRKFKQLILKKFPVANLYELKEKLPAMLDYANNLYLPVLSTLTPVEVISGMKPEDLNYKELMEQALLKRRQTNKAFNCKQRCT